MFGRSLHDGNGSVAGDGGTAQTGARAAGADNGGGAPMWTNGVTNEECVSFASGQAEELRRVASLLLERLALLERESVRLARGTKQDGEMSGELTAAQDTLAELHALDPAAFKQAGAFAGILLRVARETGRAPSAVYGETNGSAKLTEAAVRSIRRRHPAGESMESLAREYGVCRDTVKDVVQCRTWKHVGRDEPDRGDRR